MTAELVTWGGDAMPDGVTISRDAAAPVMLSRTGARRLTDRIRGSLERTLRGLVDAWNGRAHEALGYGEGAAGWQAYVAAEFGDLKLLLLPADERRELVESMTGQGMSRREVAANLGISAGTVSHIVKGRPVRDDAVVDAMVDGLRTAGVERLDDRRDDVVVVVEPPTGLSKRDRAWQLVAEQGERGLTALELSEVTGWTGGSSTGTMSDLKRQGRVVAVAVFRRGYAAHVAVEVTR
jgi:hypothetical protein